MTILIVLLGIILRLPFINQSLWLDEAIEALALQGKMGPLLSYALNDFQPPLYHLILSLWTNIFGYSEISLRAPSLLAGIGTIFFGIKIAELIGSSKAKIIAGLLLATNPLLIYYSVEGRTYALTTFFVTASFCYLFSYLKHNSIKHLLLYAIATTLFIWTSYLSWFLALSVGIYLLVKKQWRLLTALIISTSTLLLWAPSLIASLQVGASTLTTSSSWGAVVGGVSFKALALTFVKFTLGRISFDNNYLYALVSLAVLLLHALVFKLSNFKKIINKPILIIWLIAPIILSSLFALILPIYQYFRLLFVLPSYLIIIALAIASSKHDHNLARAVVLVQMLAIVYFGVSPSFHKEDWKGVVHDYKADAIYALPSLNQSAPLTYYQVPFSNLIEPKNGVPTYARKIIYIRYVEDLFDQNKEGIKNIEKFGFSMREEKSYSGISVQVYERL